MFNFKICLILLIILPIYVFTQDYCSSELCTSGPHIACNNAGNFAPSCGSKPRIIKITPQLRKLIVTKHNTLRNKIAGGFNKYEPAVRMATMVWNQELAKLAEYNVKQCQMKHDKCRNTNSFRFAGQNLASSSWSGTTQSVANVARTHIQHFFNEYKDCDMAIIRKYGNNGKKIGHFTAMVQQKSTHIGCAILRQKKSNGATEQLMACNYAYTNIRNEPVYTAGKAASKCTTGVNKTFKNLCSAKEKYNVNSVK